MANIKRYQDPQGHVFSVTAEEAAAKGYTPYVGAAETPAAEAPEYPKHTGGGYYELSNGDRVQGKAAAAEAEAAIKKEN